MSDKRGKPYRRDEDITTVVIKAENLDTTMVDRRPRKGNQSLGTVRQCLAQYGLSLKEKDGRAYLKAPRNRMQLFLEKLHYSGLPYKVMGRPM